MVSKKIPNSSKGKVKKSPKKSPQKTVTISSMFQKQIKQAASGRTSETKNNDVKPSRKISKKSIDDDSLSLASDDSDCEITGFESKYFKTETNSKTSSVQALKPTKMTRSRRLSLKKAESETSDSKLDFSLNTETADNSQLSEELRCDASNENDETEDECCHSITKDISEAECSTVIERRVTKNLSLQKRKSSSEEFISRKKARVEEDNSVSIEFKSSDVKTRDTLINETSSFTESIITDTQENDSKSDACTPSAFQSSIADRKSEKTDEDPSSVELVKFELVNEKGDSAHESGVVEGMVAQTSSDCDLTQSSQMENEESEFIISDDVSLTGDDQNVKFRVPYYLENFKTICNSVMEDTDNLRLFDEADLECVELFNNLSEPSQKLYVRLFGRKYAWLPLTKIKYSEISDDLSDIIKELVQAGLMISESELTDLDKILKLLSAPDLKTLAKSYRLNITGLLKSQIVDLLLKKSKQNTIGSFFTKNTSKNQTDTMSARAKKYLGNSVKLEEHPRAVFVRILLLFSVVRVSTDDDSAAGGQGQLFQMLMVNMGKVVYPTYTVNKKTKIFKDKQSLLNYEKALQLETELLTKIEKKDFEGAYELYIEANKEFQEIIKDKTQLKADSEYPVFLRSFTTGYLYTRILNQGIDIIQRRKEYRQAVELLESLLEQDVYCTDYRGYWWERQALNLESHLKQPQKALEAIKKGLDDPYVKVGHRYALFLRAEKLCNSNAKWKERIKEFEHEVVIEAPKHYFEGRVLPHAIPGSRFVFMTGTSYTADNEEVTACGVEQLSLEHYRENGFPEGLHAEGSIVSNLFCLFFWDILFMDVADVFHGPYQTSPLDSQSSMFYHNRQTTLDQRLAVLGKSSEEELHSRLSATWEEHNGEMCAGMNWERFKSIEHAQGLVSCFGGVKLARLLERYVKNPRHTRSGFPDLTLWNTETKQLKIVEVKGPGDRLSHKQMLWLDYLIKLGIDAEVCHVKAIGAKMLRAAR